MRKDQEGGHPNKSGRHRSLNVIYFVDASKTRSFALSLPKVYTLLGALTVGVTWSFVSLYYVVASLEDKDVISDRLHTALATIFEYQSRYDGVYETAYPEIQGKKEALLVATPPLLKTEPEAAKSAPATSSAVLSSHTLPPQDFTALAQDSLRLEASNPKWPIAIEDLSIHRDQDELELSFAIRNKLSPSRSEGYVWAVASLIDGRGQQSFLASPRGIKVDGQGKAESPNKAANWYSIRYYKAKNFYFSLPSNWQGHITEVVIGMMDTKGQGSTFRAAFGPRRVPALEGKSPPLGKATSDLKSAVKVEVQGRGKVASKAAPSNAQNN